MTGVSLDVMDSSSKRTARLAMIVFTGEKVVEPIRRLKTAMACELEDINTSTSRVASAPLRMRTRQVMKDNSLHIHY